MRVPHPYATRNQPYDATYIADRDGWKCSLCGDKISRSQRHPQPKALTMDHVIPLSKGGDDTRSNVKACHSLCNTVKGNRTHANGEQLLLVG